MKTTVPWILTILLAIALGVVLAARPAAKPASVAAPAPPKKILYWVDPMHPAYKSDKPGTAPDCGMALEPVYEGQASPDRYVNIGVQTAPAERRSIGRAVRTVGRVAVDETRLYKVTTKFDGYIEKLYVNYTGKEVRRGEPLFAVYSPELLASQQEYLLALRAAKQSPLLLEAAKQRLRLWDISDAEIGALERTRSARKTLTIASPSSGFVLTKNAVEGAKISAGDPMFEIASLGHVWVLADVYEAELPFVRVGSPASMTLSYIPGRTWQGRVTFIAPAVDPATRTVKVRLEFDNGDAALKPEMFADVTIEQPARDAIAVPDSAVLQTGTRSIVYVAAANGTFEPREVQTGTTSEHYTEIRSGLAPGEQVATQANFLIDSETKLKAESRKQKAERGTDDRSD